MPGSKPLRAFGEQVEHVVSRSLRLTDVSARRPAGLTIAQGGWKGEPVELVAHVHEGEMVSLARFVMIEGPALTIFNALVLPSPRVATGMLGIDVVATRRDRTLVVADVMPTPAWDECAANDLSDEGEHLPPAGAMPSWASRWFSARALHRAVGPDDLEVALRAAMRRVQGFVDCAFGSAIEDAARIDATRRFQAEYLVAHRREDRSLDLIGRMFGTDWADEFISRILFPEPGQELHVG